MDAIEIVKKLREIKYRNGSSGRENYRAAKKYFYTELTEEERKAFHAFMGKILYDDSLTEEQKLENIHNIGKDEPQQVHEEGIAP